MGRFVYFYRSWVETILKPRAEGCGLLGRASVIWNNQATSCPSLVNLRPVISEFTLLKRAIFAAIRPQFDDNLHS